MKIAIVVSRFNESITTELTNGAVKRLIECGVLVENIDIKTVPGAIEIPIIVKQFAMKKNVDAIIAFGAVIRGETSHYDYVCDQVSHGCQKIMLDYNVPVIFGVLTTENMQQAKDRTGGSVGHNGVYAADAAIEMIQLMQSF